MTSSRLEDTGSAGAATDVSPYVGLSYYTEDEAEWFFGRDDETHRIIANLRAARLTILYARSGVGKSSLLRAGVSRQLRELAARRLTRRGSPGYVPVVMSAWKDDPAIDLIASIEQSLDRLLPGGSRAELPRDSLPTAIEAATAASGARLLVVLDQFEEYFIYRTRESVEGRFADELAACVNRPDLRANFLIAIREDAYAGLGDLFAGRLPNVYGNYIELAYLDRDAARETIVKPIEQFNNRYSPVPPIQIEPELVEAVLTQVRIGEVEVGSRGQGVVDGGNRTSPQREEIETPYLQLVISTLWEDERAHASSLLRLATLEELGGANEIVRTHLDGALATFTAEEQGIALDAFRYLVTPSGTKIVHAASDLAQLTDRPQDEVARVLGRLAESDTRILRHVPPPAGRTHPQDRYEIFHDVLAPAILDWRRRTIQERDQERAKHERARLEAERREAIQAASRERRRARIFRGLAALLGISLAGVIAWLIATALVADAQRNNARREALRARLLAHEATQQEQRANRLAIEARHEARRARSLAARNRKQARREAVLAAQADQSAALSRELAATATAQETRANSLAATNAQQAAHETVLAAVANRDSALTSEIASFNPTWNYRASFISKLHRVAVESATITAPPGTVITAYCTLGGCPHFRETAHAGAGQTVTIGSLTPALLPIGSRVTVLSSRRDVGQLLVFIAVGRNGLVLLRQTRCRPVGSAIPASLLPPMCP